ncbi:preprotein translocase subunit SecB [Pseudoalteromonas sp. MEBiC 03485]|uniref:preprotein translocase subunit SecB n=1 Tax=Pseudoalteromonas sp. MEBiC 03485 TaxID=2571103 RepID=UPI001021DD93|nr:preprotein translocase subunit SecB [Pseudoalteromonas sp. MEBiC 03485]RZD20078.1 preprotein translocase subunit SecB [Pseudoalteromonas sp. MEBiC 03485]
MANTGDFQKAKDTLKSHDVYVKNTNCFTRSDFDPKRTDFDNLVYQFMHVVKGSEVFGVQDTDDNEEYFFKVYVDVGCRFIKEEDKENKDSEPLAQIEATFCAEYQMFDKEIDEDSLKVFALQNVSYHVWPFWREHLMNMCNRLNLPKVALPTMQVKPQNGNTE